MRLPALTFPVALLALLLPGGGALVTRAAPPAPAAGFHPVIAVETTYPGANAQVVAESVADPIEQQVNGAEHLTHMVSRCTNDGRYTLLLSFDPRVDLNIAQVLVQNRVNLALPVLPDAVKQGGVTTRKLLPGAVLLVVLTSPDGGKGAGYLGTYAALQIKDELVRLAGVSEVSLVGGEDVGLRVILDPEKLAARSLTPAEVVKALREQKVQEKAKPADQPPAKPGEVFQLRLDTVGKGADPEALAAVVLKAAPDGRTIRLKDVARVELGRGSDRGGVSFDGRPAVVLAVAALPTVKPQDVSATVRQRMERLKKSFPPGLEYNMALDLTARPAPRSLLAEPALPPASSPERAEECRTRYAEILKKTEGVSHVLSLPEAPLALFRGGPCAVAVFDKDIKEADWNRKRQAVRDRLAREVRPAALRLRDLSGPAGVRREGYPVDFALRDFDDNRKEVRDFAEALAARLARTGKLTDVDAGPKATTMIYADVDRKRAMELGVSLNDVFQTLQVALDSAEVGEGNPPGDASRVRTRVSLPPRETMETIKKLQVRNAKGEMVPLSSVVSLKEVEGPARIDRVDLRPSALMSGNPAPGVSLAEARWLCETLAEQARKERRLAAEYRLAWLGDVPAPKPMPGEPKPGPEPAPREVTVAQPISREVTDYEDFTGRVEAVESVSLRPRVSGYLDKVLFKDGAEVKKGDALFVIDQRPYQAALDQAQANLKAVEAQRDQNKRTLERVRAAGATAPKSDLEAAEAGYNVAAAQVEAAKATVEVAKLNLDWTTLRAPIDGRIGRHLVDVGNVVKGDETPLAQLASVDPVYVYFEADEGTVLRLERQARDAKGKPLAEADLAVSVGLSDDKDYPLRGRLNFVDNRANANTGTITMRAVLSDARRTLRPGLFARVRLAVGAPHKALLVPEGAILTYNGKKSVYVVDKDNKVVARTVALGSRREALRVISEGLTPDDRVITEGVERVRAGETVKPLPVQLKDE